MTVERGFRERLIAARSERGWSQQALAEAAGVAAAQISRYESGRSEPRPEVIARLSAALGRPFAWLAEGRSEEAATVDESGRLLVRMSIALPQSLIDALTAEAKRVDRSIAAEIRERLSKTLQSSELGEPDGVRTLLEQAAAEPLKLPPMLRKTLEVAAAANGRSLYEEAIARLQASGVEEVDLQNVVRAISRMQAELMRESEVNTRLALTGGMVANGLLRLLDGQQIEDGLRDELVAWARQLVEGAVDLAREPTDMARWVLENRASVRDVFGEQASSSPITWKRDDQFF